MQTLNLFLVPRSRDFVLLASLDLVCVRVRQRCVALCRKYMNREPTLMRKGQTDMITSFT